MLLPETTIRRVAQLRRAHPAPRGHPRLRRVRQAGAGHHQHRHRVLPRRAGHRRRIAPPPGRQPPLPRQERRPEPVPRLSTRRCPRCQATYPAPARYCVKDGSPLVEAESTATFGRRPGRTAVAAAAHGRAHRGIAVTPDELDRYATLSRQAARPALPGGRRLGEGGMSYVYRAQDVETERHRRASRSSCPACPAIPPPSSACGARPPSPCGSTIPTSAPSSAWASADGMIYLVMPYLEGEPLSEHETRRGPFAARRGHPAPGADLPRPAARARAADHAPRPQAREHHAGAGRHRRGRRAVRAVVMDFGLAKERRAGPEVAKLTATGIVLGTPEFMSPEQIRGQAARWTERRLRARHPRLRALHRPAAVRRQVGAGDDDRPAPRLSRQAAGPASPSCRPSSRPSSCGAWPSSPAERFQSMDELAHGLRERDRRPACSGGSSGDSRYRPEPPDRFSRSLTLPGFAARILGQPCSPGLRTCHRRPSARSFWPNSGPPTGTPGAIWGARAGRRARAEIQQLTVVWRCTMFLTTTRRSEEACRSPAPEQHAR